MATSDTMSKEIFPYLTPAEEAILSTLDPNFRMRDDVMKAVEQKNSFDAYMKRAAMDSPSGMVSDYQLSADMPYASQPIAASGDVQGGFAWGVALPILSQIAAPFISQGVNALDKLITGRGIQQKMGAGAALTQHFASNIDNLQEIEDELESANGRDFWLLLHGTVKDQTGNILKKIADVSDELIDPIASMSVSHMFPDEFMELLTSFRDKQGSGLTSDRGFTVGGLIAPITHFALRELFTNPKDADKVYAKMVAKGAFSDASVYQAAGISPPQTRGGSKAGWRRFVNGLKNFGKKVWGVAKNILGTVLPGIVQAAPQAIDSAVNFAQQKLNLSPGTADILRNIGNTAVSIPNQLEQGSSIKDIASNFIAPAAQLGEKAARFGIDKIGNQAVKDAASKVIDIGMQQLRGPAEAETPIAASGRKSRGRPRGAKNKKMGGLSFRVVPV